LTLRAHSLLALILPLLALSACAPISPYNVPQGHLYEKPSQDAVLLPVVNVDESRELKVLIARDLGALKLSAPGGIRLTDEASGREAFTLRPGAACRLVVRQGRLFNGSQDLGSRHVRIHPLVAGQGVQASGRRYRGTLSLVVAENKPLLINSVGLEEYLVGVLASEVPASWPMEALKSQAVAARTYALFRAAKPSSKEYDLDDTTASQAYTGMSKEHPRCAEAVKATSGRILTYDGGLVQAFFHSNCGGKTADAAKVWSAGSPYLKGVACHTCKSEKHYQWEETLLKSEAGRRLFKAGLALDADLKEIEGLDGDGTDRWYSLRVTSRKGRQEVKASALRSALGADIIRSTRFDATPEGPYLRFKGRGWGHGIGLCQEGSKGMAEQGYTYDRILEFYFPGTKLKKL
jgi:stage II sporulation protein D